jgi:hypothetical protein
MKQQTLMHGSILAVILIAAVIGVGMVTGFSGLNPNSPGSLVSDSNTAVSPAAHEQYIRIDPVAEKTTGDLLTITGATNLPAGTTLMVSAANNGGNTEVRAGTNGINRFSSVVDTTPMKPGTKTITVNNMIGDLAKGDYRPGTVKTTTTFTLKGSYLTTDTPVQATNTGGKYIRVNPIADHATGDQFLISGTTSLPVGTMIMWQIMPDTGTPPAGTNRDALGIAANGQVTKGEGSENRISLAVDMTGFKPGKWVALAGENKGDPRKPSFEMTDLTGYAYFNLK